MHRPDLSYPLTKGCTHPNIRFGYIYQRTQEREKGGGKHPQERTEPNVPMWVIHYTKTPLTSRKMEKRILYRKGGIIGIQKEKGE